MIGHDVRKRTQAAPLRACLLVSASLIAATPAALAQAADDRGAPAQTYAQDFFTAFNPVTAEDMVRRIPGFTLDNGDDRRGFGGAAGNVLINGERPSSKSPLADQLARISARDVLRIDIYSGSSDRGEASGQTLLADVRMRPRDAGATNTFVAQASQLDPSGSVNPLVVLTSGFKVGDINLNVALQAQPSRRGRVEYTKRLQSPEGALVSQGPEFLQGHYWEYKLSGRASWKPSEADSFNFNAQVTPSRDGRHTFSWTYNAAGALTQSDESEVTGDNALAAEVGVDWERRLSDETSFKLIALGSGKHTGSSERYSSYFSSGAFRNTLIERSADTGEFVGRGVFSWKPGKSHAVDFGGEFAFNYLDSALDIGVETVAGTINATPPVANTRVEENRVEAFVSDTWLIAGNLKLETTLTVETSTITQTGDASQEREFAYFKPRVGATWTIDEVNTLRFLLERDVAQLDFSEFASAVSLFDGTSDLGNPNLEPERTWRTQVEWERRFGAKGVLLVSLFNDEVQAVQDQIPIAGSFDGPGNLGEGRRTGIRVDATAPLDAIGLKGGELRLKGLLQTTNVDDPLTGESRRFSDEADWSYSIDYRQPVPELKLVWGALYERAGDVRLFRVRELRTTQWEDPNLDLYLETTIIPGMLVRFTVADVLLPYEVRERRFYSPDRSSTTNLSGIETRSATGGYGTRSYGVRVSGRF